MEKNKLDQQELNSLDLIKKRMSRNNEELLKSLNHLNAERNNSFKREDLKLLATIPVRSEKLSSPKDIFNYTDGLLVGYSIQKSKETLLSDVFSLYKIGEEESTLLDINQSILNNPKFKDEFSRMYRYYDAVQFNQFISEEDSITAVFKYGTNDNDLKGFKWDKDRNGTFQYAGEVSLNNLLSIIQKETNKWSEVKVKGNISKKIKLNDDVFIRFNNEKSSIEFISKDKVLFSEALKEKLQTFEDMEFHLSGFDTLVLVKFKPYNENSRYYIFDSVNVTINRCDSLKNNIIQLPQNNGIIFGNGYYLSKGEFKLFEEGTELNYLKTLKSPNGEDYLIVYYDQNHNSYSLFQFNLVEQSVSAPIKTRGYAITEDGKILLIKSGTYDTRDHAVQKWDSPYSSEIFYQKLQSQKEKTRLNKVGNNELVKAISAIKQIIDFIETKEVTVEIYSNVIKMIDDVIDKYHWLSMFNDLNLLTILKEEKETANLVLEEFKKVEEIKVYSQNKFNKIKAKAEEVFTKTRIKQSDIEHMMAVLVEVKALTGEVSALKGERYINQNSLDNLILEAERVYGNVNSIIAELLNKDATYVKFEEKVKELKIKVEENDTYKEISEVIKEIEEISKSIGFLNEEIGNLNFEDNRVLSEVLEKVAMLFSAINQIRSIAKNKESKLALEEAHVEFGSQSKILEQTLENSLMKSTTIEKSDEEYAKVLSLIQNLESRFSHIGDENFSKAIEEQKNDIVSAFAAHKKTLRNKLQEKVGNLRKAVEVSLKTIANKADKAFSLNEISTLFLTDGVIIRANTMIDEIATYGEVTIAEELKGQINQLRKKAIKRVRDDSDLFEDQGNILKLGNHKFSVNKKPFDIVLIKNNGKIYSHVETTKYYKEIPLLESQKNIYDVWDYDVISENKDLYRSEFLAYSILQDARNGVNGLSNNMINEILRKGVWNNKQVKLINVINNYSSKLFREGYIKGVHDLDAEKIVVALNDVYEKSTDVRFSSDEKIAAILLYSHIKKMKKESIFNEVKNGISLIEKINSSVILDKARTKIRNEFDSIDLDLSLDVLEYMVKYVESAKYCSKEVSSSYEEMKKILGSFLGDFKEEINSETCSLEHKMVYISELRNMLNDYCKFSEKTTSIVEELIIYFMRKEILSQSIEVKDFNYSITISGLMGSHNSINEKGELTITVEDFNRRNKIHREKTIPLYDLVDKIRADILKKEKESINLNSMIAKPLVSFVKNKLISQSYLPKFGSNFAKQIGETGKNKRADTMGMLLLTSPPGYGKTTLVEYIVDKLGMLFVKINCPSIGHEITSLDPSQATNLTARNEIEKINFAFEMGDNVCLYLDDIQHTNPEFLQKFISLCDGTRTVDGVWQGESKTYNLRGRRFSVVMAGNPYTESGEMFKIPDMLANRADTYNLGEISSDDKHVFELSYIENALTSNNVTASLMDRSANDIYLFLKQIEGIHVDNEAFDNEYSDAEAEEIRAVLRIMKRIQKTILKVNQQYIYSASQSDEYRIEPAFKLQGSYRNMSKIMEKVLPLMTENEVDSLIMDHYQSEAQTLTKSNEENLLKFKEIFGNMNEEEKARWEFLKQEFMKGKKNAEQESIAVSLKDIADTLKMFAEKK